MGAERPGAQPQTAVPGANDPVSRRWTDGLRRGSPRHDETVAKLHATLLRVAHHELGRRRHAVHSITGPELDDLAQQAADDAVMNIMARVETFQGTSRFTTWAYKFVVFEVSNKIGRHAWRRQPPLADEVAWSRLTDALARRPEGQAEQREQLAALSAAVTKDLTARQREVFVAVALNDVPIDALADRLGSTRNAIYKNLFDARRSLRASLAAAGHPVPSTEAST